MYTYKITEMGREVDLDINLHILIIISNERTLLYNFVPEFPRKNYQDSSVGSGVSYIRGNNDGYECLCHLFLRL